MTLTTEAKINTNLSCFEDAIDLFNATKITPISERFDKEWNKKKGTFRILNGDLYEFTHEGVFVKPMFENKFYKIIKTV
jgi:hypothetical protein